MKKLLNFVLIGFICLTIIGCNRISEINIGEKSKYVVADDLVSMSIKEGTLTSSKATIILINNENEPYMYGEHYSIEYEKDGQWYEIIPENDMVFNDIGYILNPKESKEMIIDWEYHYGKLPSGKYRIIKNFFPELNESIIENDYLYIGAEFIIK